MGERFPWESEQEYEERINAMLDLETFSEQTHDELAGDASIHATDAGGRIAISYDYGQ